MHPVAYLNEIPKPIWLALMIMAFAWHWPVGLAILAYLIGSGRIGRRWQAGGPGRWYNCANGPATPWGKWGQGPAAPPPSGNKAFDDYRAETLRRLEDEQKEFVDYLDRLRQAKDKAEFDQFMADRRPPEAQPPQ